MNRHGTLLERFLGCVNPGILYKSLHALPACQAIGTQFGARQRRRTPMIHRGRAAQQIRPAGRWEEIEQVAGRHACNAGENLGPRPAGRAAIPASRDPGIEGSPNRSLS